MRSQPNRNYISDDCVMTPQALADALVDALQPQGRVLEPCAGDGAFSRAITRVNGEVLTCEIRDGSDFYEWDRPVDWIVTNPPWSQFRGFVEHALKLEATNVAMLATVNHWWTKRRVRAVMDAGYRYRQLLLMEWPKEFKPTGFQLGMMHLQRGYDGPMDIRWVSY